MTIRQAKTLELLPKHNFQISPAMKEANYPLSTTKNGTMIKRLRNVAIREGILPSKQEVIGKFQEVYTLSRKARDRTNMARISEDLARCQGMFTDNIKADINDTRSDDILKKHRLGIL